MSELEISSVLAAWGLEDADARAIEVGNINRTFLIRSGDDRWILQRLNPIFAPEVHHDIDAITRQLAAAGMTTPRLLPTREQQLWHTDAADYAWRLQSYIDGHNHSHATSPTLARAAGTLLGRFHRALAELDYVFQSRRLGVHDTDKHLARLRDLLDEGRSHPGASAAKTLGDEILTRMEARPTLDGLPERIVHGDPKLNNIIFTGDDEPICFIDLDTVSRMPLPVELGDALRSWCNPSGEDAAQTHFDIDYFAAGLAGYADSAGELLDAREVRAIPTAVETITLELASRFCADILAESYFAWDKERYAAAWEHNRVRAESQLQLARSFADQRQRAEQIVAELFATQS